MLACLILNAYLKTTYRGNIDLLDASDALRKRLGLERLPHFSTLKKFADRSSVLEVMDAMLVEIVRTFAHEGDDEAAIDSTGMEIDANPGESGLHIAQAAIRDYEAVRALHDANELTFPLVVGERGPLGPV